MLNRRQALLSSGALALSACATTAPPAADASADAALDALLRRHFDARLARNPEQATSLGLDVGERAALRSRLSDLSPAGVVRARLLAASEWAELRAIPRARLSAAAQESYDVAAYQLEMEAAFGRFPYHSAGALRSPGPYAVTQFGGAYTTVPRLLDTQHPVETREDAEAYLARLEGFARAVDADTEMARANAAAGIVAPAFILENAVRQIAALRDASPTETGLVRSLARRAAEKGLGDYGPRARAIFEGPVRAALDRQHAFLGSLNGRGPEAPGVDRLPDGGAYYAQTLRLHTTTDMGPDEIHRMGLEQVAELEARIDALLRPLGYTSGTVGQRLSAMGAEPANLFPNTDAGRAQAIAYCNERLAAIRERLPRVFNRMPRTGMEIRRVPAEIEAGAAGGSAQPGSLDGTRPGIFWINLRDTADWPRFSLPTLTYHEAAPGHLFEGSLLREDAGVPEYRKVGNFPAYGEGWALYSERVADELGMYEDDPRGRIGYLNAYLFRAIRLVVDTGLHSKGWSRQRAIDYMTGGSARALGSTVREIDRYIVMPGQACAYKIGQTVIANLRDEAERRPGFDIKTFHERVLSGGRMPLTVLQRRVRARAG